MIQEDAKRLYGLLNDVKWPPNEWLMKKEIDRSFTRTISTKNGGAWYTIKTHFKGVPAEICYLEDGGMTTKKSIALLTSRTNVNSFDQEVALVKFF